MRINTGTTKDNALLDGMPIGWAPLSPLGGDENSAPAPITTSAVDPLSAVTPNLNNQKQNKMSAKSTSTKSKPYFKLSALPLAADASWAVPALCAAYNWPTGLVGGGTIGI